MSTGETNLSAEGAKSALPNSIINTQHKRGLHARGGENLMIKRETAQPELYIDGGICYVDGRVVSRKEYDKIVAQFKNPS